MGFWDRLSRTLDELSEELLPDQVRDSVDQARRLLEHGDAQSAIPLLEKLLKFKPDHATALFLLGAAHLRLGRPEIAGSHFERAAGARAGFVEATIGLGEALLSQGDAPRAVTKLREAIAMGGSREALADAYRILGRAYVALGQSEKGLRELRKALAEAPGDVDTALALASALLADPAADPEEARSALATLVDNDDPPSGALAALGRLELRAGHLQLAEKLLQRALDRPPPLALEGGERVDALAALADVHLRRGDARAAHERLLMALALAPQRPDLHARLGDMHRVTASPEAALDAYDRAIALFDGSGALVDELRRRALVTALEAGLPERGEAHAEAIFARAPAYAPAIAARAGKLLRDGDPLGARRMVAEALGRAPDPWLFAMLAEVDLAADAPAAAAEAALAAVRLAPGHAVALRLLAEARRRELGIDAPASDLYTLAGRVHGLVASRPELAELTADALRALESYDRPLLVTVMGEFSSGKSTFVNAFLGAEVAPVGITPTTATINVLKYGREKGGRVVYRDDRVRDLAWDEVPRTLRAIDRDEAKRIRHVEVLYPVESLQRVNIVDTPGLNSIEPEHEETARQFIAQADAVVWLFTIGQAGKASEREALTRIRIEGKRILGVVNKIDQVPADQVDVILGHLRGELGEYVEDLVPVSARRALAARKTEDAEALAASQWPVLDAALEARFFQQARALKRDACGRRLALILGEARRRVTARVELAETREAALRQAAAAASADAALFGKALVAEEKRGLAERSSAAYRAAARDVLELVRPRKTPFGSHTAAAADRDYLIGFLERSLAEVLAPTHARAVAELRRAGDEALVAARAARDVIGDTAPELERHRDAAIALVEAAVFDRASAYLRGYLQGGRIDEFFRRALPKLELTEDSVYHALVRDAPDLETELVSPLATRGEQALRGLAARLDTLAAQAAVARREADALLAAIDGHDEARARLTQVAER